MGPWLLSSVGSEAHELGGEALHGEIVETKIALEDQNLFSLTPERRKQNHGFKVQ